MQLHRPPPPPPHTHRHLATLTAAHHAAQQRCAQLHTTLTTSTTNLEQWAVKLQAVQQAVQDAQQALEAEQQRAQEGDGRCETLQALQQQETEQLARWCCLFVCLFVIL